MLHLKVSDNGIGFSEERKEQLGESFGYHLIEAFAGQLREDLTVDGNSGTTVELSIQKYVKV